jgi:hypothetical protein
MANWLQKTFNLPQNASKSGNLPMQAGKPSLPPLPQNLPNATVIYGIGAGLLFVAAFFLLAAGRWFPGLLVIILGACLTGFALHLLKHQD